MLWAAVSLMTWPDRLTEKDLLYNLRNGQISHELQCYPNCWRQYSHVSINHVWAFPTHFKHWMEEDCEMTCESSSTTDTDPTFIATLQREDFINQELQQTGVFKESFHLRLVRFGNKGRREHRNWCSSMSSISREKLKQQENILNPEQCNLFQSKKPFHEMF